MIGNLFKEQETKCSGKPHLEMGGLWFRDAQHSLWECGSPSWAGRRELCSLWNECSQETFCAKNIHVAVSFLC